jgi:hypothetical protein
MIRLGISEGGERFEEDGLGRDDDEIGAVVGSEAARSEKRLSSSAVQRKSWSSVEEDEA